MFDIQCPESNAQWNANRELILITTESLRCVWAREMLPVQRQSLSMDLHRLETAGVPEQAGEGIFESDAGFRDAWERPCRAERWLSDAFPHWPRCRAVWGHDVGRRFPVKAYHDLD